MAERPIGTFGLEEFSSKKSLKYFLNSHKKRLCLWYVFGSIQMGTLALQIEITAIKTHFSFKYMPLNLNSKSLVSKRKKFFKFEWCHFCERLKNEKRIHYAIFGLAKVAFLVSKNPNR